MVVVFELSNWAMSVAVGTVLVVQLVPVFQSLVAGAGLQASGVAGALRMRKTSCGL